MESLCGCNSAYLMPASNAWFWTCPGTCRNSTGTFAMPLRDAQRCVSGLQHWIVSSSSINFAPRSLHSFPRLLSLAFEGVLQHKIWITFLNCMHNSEYLWQNKVKSMDFSFRRWLRSGRFLMLEFWNVIKRNPSDRRISACRVQNRSRVSFDLGSLYPQSQDFESALEACSMFCFLITLTFAPLEMMQIFGSSCLQLFRMTKSIFFAADRVLHHCL